MAAGAEWVRLDMVVMRIVQVVTVVPIVAETAAGVEAVAAAAVAVEETDPMTRFSRHVATAVTCALLIVTGCGKSIDTQSTVVNQREYEKTVSRDDQQLLKATCTYLGKQPKDADEFKAKHDYKTNDTDFYEVILENRSPRAIELLGVDHRMHVGQYRGQSHFDARELANAWGASRIEPGATLTRDTHFVWAVKSSNTLYKKLSLQSVDKSGKTFQFEVDLPLLYKR